MHLMSTSHNAISLIDRHVSVPFEECLSRIGSWPVIAQAPSVLQMNLGYRCNQTCAHCHIQASPERTEGMTTPVIRSALEFASRAGITDFDLTGGAPELHPRFRRLVKSIRSHGGRVTDRCNLTILTEPGQEDLAEFLAANGVKVVASLPCYTPAATNQTRGDGVFERSIAGLQALNAVGYGRSDGELELVLAHSPEGASLPGVEESLAQDYRYHLREDYGISFTRLIAMANMPVGRFLDSLVSTDGLGPYMRELEQSLNPDTIPSLMCRQTISVGWDGVLYDCDFNQALGLNIRNGGMLSIQDVSVEMLAGRAIRCGSHCYGCTAGQGSSCSGAVAA